MDPKERLFKLSTKIIERSSGLFSAYYEIVTFKVFDVVVISPLVPQKITGATVRKLEVHKVVFRNLSCYSYGP